MWQNTGFWFAIGIIVGIILEYAGRLFFEWFYRPILRVHVEADDVWWDVKTEANLAVTQVYTALVPQLVDSIIPTEPYADDIPIRAYRLRVNNDGRRAADNVTGTVELAPRIERRICWYIGNTATTTINAHDWSYLDVYGVILGRSDEPSTICMPTENGWQKLTVMRLTSTFDVRLRITARNTALQRVHFRIDPKNKCRPYWVHGV